MKTPQLSALLVLAALLSCCHSQPLSAPAPSPASSSCTLTPELTEGPYWLNDQLLRGNITEGQAGIPFNLTIVVKDITTCLPVAGAFVDVWHCNATGHYSGFEDNSSPTTASSPAGASSLAPAGASSVTAASPLAAASDVSGAAPAGAMPSGGGPGFNSTSGGPGGSSGGGMSSAPTTTETFLRGIVQTDADGVASFQTIQPGWYAGRTTHIHVKVHIPTNTSTTELGEYVSSYTVHTGQLFFSEAHMTQVAAISPYNTDTATRTALTSDTIYNNPVEVLNITYISATDLNAGLVATIDANVDTTVDYTPTSTASNVATVAPTFVEATAPSSAVPQAAPVSGVVSTTTGSTSSPTSSTGSTASSTATTTGSTTPLATASPVVSGAAGAVSFNLAGVSVLASTLLLAVACF